MESEAASRAGKGRARLERPQNGPCRGRWRRDGEQGRMPIQGGRPRLLTASREGPSLGGKSTREGE